MQTYESGLVLTMLVGELEYEDLFYKREREERRDGEVRELFYPITSYVLYTVFLLLVTIVVMNLLVGLAVSDIQVSSKYFTSHQS
jgi:hypothetical protein